jgi:uncharacterized protein YggE
MKSIAIPLLVLAGMVMGIGTATTRQGRAETLVALQEDYSHTDRELSATATEGVALSPTRNLTAQLFYPPASDQQAFRVVGKGRASGPADTARIAFKFGSSALESAPDAVLSQFEVVQAVLTRENLQPIVDALVAIGVPTDAIDVKITEAQPSVLPFPFPSTGTEGSAGIVVRLEQPTRDRIEQIVTVTTEAAGKNEVLIVGSVGIEYSVNDCQALEKAAYQAAVNDALNRARAIAEPLGADIGIPSVAEPFYEIFLPGCSSEGSFPFANSTAAYDPDAPAEVVVTKDIFFSFPVD